MPDDGVQVKVIGFDELVAGTRRLAGKIDRRAVSELERLAQRRADTVRARVPRLTGRLAGSITTDGMAEGALVGMGDGGTPYAGWIEFGGTRGRPYLPEGRYLYPVALDTQGLERDANHYTAEEIRAFVWPKPTEL